MQIIPVNKEETRKCPYLGKSLEGHFLERYGETDPTEPHVFSNTVMAKEQVLLSAPGEWGE